MFRVRIVGNKESLEVLCKNYKNLINFEMGSYYLECQQFQSMNTDEIFSFAQNKLQNMIFWLNVKLGGLLDIEIHYIEEIKRDGTKSIIVAPMTVTAVAKVGIPTIRVQDKETGIVKITDPQVASGNLENDLNCIENNQRILDALMHYNRDLNWVNLFKVYEIIEHDMGGKIGIVNQSWATDAEINLFRCTAHNVDGAGRNARHGVREKIRSDCQNILSNQNPMELSFAIEIIRRILDKWVAYRCP